MKLCMCFEVGLVGKSMITAVYGVCMIDVWNGAFVVVPFRGRGKICGGK